MKGTKTFFFLIQVMSLESSDKGEYATHPATWAI